ncbi:hypothetical protein NW752_009126 [Fusarium irregulare]|uniref:Uncharacterized protein n=1 Tax=Fusarium irregulare TaxID=2494466 RepID=A0A9W8PJT6_9HYPO|nr:hypothetical protein NW766_008652 [Fusarium irregulare]KAJ4009951.1 hypothetical protein NW752_009126 [Fusarium irregulare]
MKFIPVAIAFLSTLALAAPSTAGELEKRGCSCKKVGDEWICGGTTCPRALPDESHFQKRQCSCKKVAGEWICSGRKCPRSVPDEAELAKRQCSCKKLPNGEYICSGPKCVSKRGVSYMEEVD